MVRLACILLAAAMLAAGWTGTASAQGAEPIPLRPWFGKLYPEFGVNVLWPPEASLEDNLASLRPRDGHERLLRAEIDLAGGRYFLVIVDDLDQDPDILGPRGSLESYVDGRGVTNLREVKRSVGQAWQFDRVEEGRRIRTEFIAVPPRYVILESVSGAGGQLDPDTDQFLTSTMVFRR